MIPRTLHQVWIGPNEPPQWQAGWQAAHLGWEYRLWGDTEVAGFGLQHQRLVDAYLADGMWAGASNVIRVEILHRHGGLYVDSDFECLHTLDGAPILRRPVLAVWEPWTHHTKIVMNGFMGAPAGHPVLDAYMQRLHSIGTGPTDLHPSWRTTGPMLWTELLLAHGIKPVPAELVMPVDMGGRRIADDQYATHHFYTTRMGSEVPEPLRALWHEGRVLPGLDQALLAVRAGLPADVQARLGARR